MAAPPESVLAAYAPLAHVRALPIPHAALYRGGAHHRAPKTRIVHAGRSHTIAALLQELSQLRLHFVAEPEWAAPRCCAPRTVLSEAACSKLQAALLQRASQQPPVSVTDAATGEGGLSPPAAHAGMLHSATGGSEPLSEELHTVAVLASGWIRGGVESACAGIARLWPFPARLCATIEAYVAALGHQQPPCELRKHTDRHHRCTTAVVVLSCLSHPAGGVRASCAHLVCTLPHAHYMELLPALIWRLQQPIGADQPVLRAGAGEARRSGCGPGGNSNSGPSAAVCSPDAMQELLSALPPPCEALCAPIALLKAHDSVWQSAPVLGMLLNALERVRCALCARVWCLMHTARACEGPNGEGAVSEKGRAAAMTGKQAQSGRGDAGRRGAQPPAQDASAGARFSLLVAGC